MRKFHSIPSPIALSKILILILFVLVSGIPFEPLRTNIAAAAEVGEAKRVKNQVTGSKGNRRLSRNDAVFSGERIRAGRNSHGELLLNDNSKIIVGANSSVRLDGFSVSNGNINKATLNLAKGALRLITGNKAKKGAYTVKTPNATIGARGTSFDTYVNSNGSTDVVLIGGSVRVCSGGACRIFRATCEIIRVTGRSGNIKSLDFLRSTPANRSEEDRSYNLLDRQGKYASRWRLPTIGCIARRNKPYDPGLGEGNGLTDRQRITPIQEPNPITDDEDDDSNDDETGDDDVSS